MKNNKISIWKYAGLGLCTVLAFTGINAQVNTQTFAFTGGTQTFVVPPCVTSLSVDLRGARGGTSFPATHVGGNGGRLTGVLPVTPGQTLYVYVGGAGTNAAPPTQVAGGFNGGGNGGASGSSYGGGGGGGATDLRLNGILLSNRVAVAGGGGGGAFNYGTSNYDRGGAGGGTTGESGYGNNTAGYNGNPGTGGSQTAGGLPGFYSGYCTASAGALGIGGHAGTCGNSGGGGGGGYYGGGGGVWAGGGGGSNYADATMTGVVHAQGTNTLSNGLAILTYSFNAGITTATVTPPVVCIGSSATITANPNQVSYTWSPISSGSNTLVVTPTSFSSYTIAGTNSLGCVSAVVVTVDINTAVPSLTVMASTNNTCMGTSVLLTASGAISYSWTNGVTNGVPFVPMTTNVYTVSGTNACGTTTATTPVTITPLPVSVIANPTNVCAGSSTSLSAAAAATNYTWLPINASGTSGSFIHFPSVSTIYTVVASNGICGGTATVAVSAMPVPTITAAASSTNICAGETVTLSASGGLNYTWTPVNLNGQVVTVTPTAPIMYSVAADNSFGCYSGASQVVIVAPSPTVNLTTNEPMVCLGSSATLIATGNGTSYQWSSGGTASQEVVSPVANTVYSLVCGGTTNTCVTTQTIEVTVFIPAVSITGNTTICNGGTSTLVASGANAYTWNPSGTPFSNITVTPNNTTTYTVSTITSTNSINCAADFTVQVMVNPTPTITVTSDRPQICKNETVTLTAGGASTYLWNTSANTMSITATTSLVTTLIFTVTGTNAQGCSAAKTIQVAVNGCNSISESTGTSSNLSLFPNPSNGEFTISHTSNVTLSVINNLGQLVKEIELNEANNFTQKVSDLSSGIYFISGDDNGQAITGKVIVNK